MTGLRGYFHPKTATGASSLIPSPPWRYSGDLLTVEYRTDPARVRELLPEPLELAEEDPGAVALIWADWQSCSTSGDELLDPVRAQYKEAFAVVRCRFRGQTYSRCVHIWVDKDFAIARGLHQGYPKKLGSIHQTRPHPYGPAPRIEAGARFGATLAAADRRLAQAVVTWRGWRYGSRSLRTTGRSGWSGTGGGCWRAVRPERVPSRAGGRVRVCCGLSRPRGGAAHRYSPAPLKDVQQPLVEWNSSHV